MPEPDPRHTTAADAAEALEAARPRLRDAHTLAGFDGFVDSIIQVPATRTGPGHDDYVRMESMRELAERIQRAAGKSANFELIVRRVKLGGNGPILAGALTLLGAPVDYIGNIGVDNRRAEAMDASATHEVFHDFSRRCKRVFTLGPPGFTDALEFDDGKLLLGKLAALETVTWPNVLEAVGGVEPLAKLIEESRLLIAANWTMLHHMGAIWDGLRDEVLPRVDDDVTRRMFVDLADPAKRSDEDLRGAMERLARLNERLEVTLGLNAAEAARIAELVGHAGPSDDRGDETPTRFSMEDAAGLRTALGLASVVIHNPRGAVAAGEASGGAFVGPYVKKPVISTGAGDHFNAGFAFALSLGLPMEQCLASGAAVSGWYVRTGFSPDLETTIRFLRELPAPE